MILYLKCTVCNVSDKVEGIFRHKKTKEWGIKVMRNSYGKGTRGIAMFLSMCLIWTSIPITARAENGGAASGLCPHHTEHTAECGYVPSVEGRECAHVHDESCGYAEKSPCLHEHTAECGEDGKECTHVHDESCGYKEASECTHVHDGNCGYAEAAEGSPCGYVCEICMAQNVSDGTADEGETAKNTNAEIIEATEAEETDDVSERLGEQQGEAVAETGGNIASGNDWTIDESGKLTIETDDGMTDWCKNVNTYKGSVKRAEIKSGVTSIGNNAFYECSSLTGITVPGSVTSIGEHAFSGCSSLTGITIPEDVASIGDYAFWGCSSLTEITMQGEPPKLGYDVFEECQFVRNNL